MNYFSCMRFSEISTRRWLESLAVWTTLCMICCHHWSSVLPDRHTWQLGQLYNTPVQFQRPQNSFIPDSIIPAVCARQRQTSDSGICHMPGLASGEESSAPWLHSSRIGPLAYSPSGVYPTEMRGWRGSRQWKAFSPKGLPVVWR